jgi:zinc D-Ala-D-Ala carboxypeptidase
MDKQLTPHFNLSEFRCPCCDDVIESAAFLLAARLEPVRLIFGPIIITSGYRCQRHNTAIGGRTFSQHLTGQAADILCTTDHARFILVKALLDWKFLRIGIAKDSIHTDLGTPTGPLIWTYY